MYFDVFIPVCITSVGWRWRQREEGREEEKEERRNGEKEGGRKAKLEKAKKTTLLINTER